MKVTPFILCAGLCVQLAVFSDLSAQNPLTVAESSGYEKTSLYEDVYDFIYALQQKTHLIRIESIGKSAEGRDIPLMIIGDPVPVSPNELRDDNRAVIYFQAGIHPGEVEGKEAVLMLTRDLLSGGRPEYLDQFILLITPLLNPDGNDKLSPHNRRDNGPEEAGIRYNAMNLDLNRDAVKLETPELRAVMKNIINRWDPLVFVDCHTTNGSYHDHPVTYLWGLNPNGDTKILEYTRAMLLKDITEILRGKYNFSAIPYGNFLDWREPEKGWFAVGPQPMYMTNYFALRNRFSILLENYAHADFKTRVWGNYYFLKAVLDYAYENKDEMISLAAEADRKTIERGLNTVKTDSFAVTYENRALKDKIVINGYEHLPETRPDGRQWYRKGEEKVKIEVPLLHEWIPARQAARPSGYFLTLHDAPLIENLKTHGILVEQLQAPVTTEAESFIVTGAVPAARLNQGHYQTNAEGFYQTGQITFPAGTYYVSTAQPLGHVAVYLLEPESDNGLVVWNFFDRYISRQWGAGELKAPIYKLYKPVNMVKETI